MKMRKTAEKSKKLLYNKPMEKKETLKSIFFHKQSGGKSNWEKFLLAYGSQLRPEVIKEVEKWRKCGRIENGFKLFVCEGCNEIKVLPYTCKGRFCTTCSVGESEEWARLMYQETVQKNHRHVILTIDEGLRVVFLKYRDRLLKPFMDEGAKLLQDFFARSSVTPGIIVGLHTFGSTLEFNPHLHMLVTMGGMKKTGEWKSYDYLPFEMLRKQWQTVVLKLIRKELTTKEKQEIQPLLQAAYTNNPNGFYIYAPKQRGSIRHQLVYIARYFRRPAIGKTRIVLYTGEEVIISYTDKQDGEIKGKSFGIMEFIGKLVRHIPDEQFKTIRHYGIYSRRSKKASRKRLVAWAEKVRQVIYSLSPKLKKRNWREKRQASEKKDPLVCPVCKNYFIYMGEVCPKSGKLRIKYSKSLDATRYMRERIEAIETKEHREEQEKARQAAYEKICFPIGTVPI